MMLNSLNETFTAQLVTPITIKGVNFLKAIPGMPTVLDNAPDGWNVEAVYNLRGFWQYGVNNEGFSDIADAVNRCWAARSQPGLRVTNIVRLDWRPPGSPSHAQAVPTGQDLPAEHSGWLEAFISALDHFLRPNAHSDIVAPAPTSPVATIFIIGNEPNHQGGPDDPTPGAGTFTSSKEYTDKCKALWRDERIRQMRRTYGIKLLLAGPAPWQRKIDPEDRGNPDGAPLIDDIEWMGRVAERIGEETDGFSLHAYLSPRQISGFQGCPDPQEVCPATKQAGAPFPQTFSFRRYRDLIKEIDARYPGEAEPLPIYITEFNTRGWAETAPPSVTYGEGYNGPGTLMDAFFREVQTFNARPTDNHSAPLKRNWKVHALCWFVDDPQWPRTPEDTSAVPEWVPFALSYPGPRDPVDFPNDPPKGRLSDARRDFMEAKASLLPNLVP
jgi:hypothetical protein